jgi:hypothetical protein
VVNLIQELHIIGGQDEAKEIDEGIDECRRCASVIVCKQGTVGVLTGKVDVHGRVQGFNINSKQGARRGQAVE